MAGKIVSEMTYLLLTSETLNPATIPYHTMPCHTRPCRPKPLTVSLDKFQPHRRVFDGVYLPRLVEVERGLRSNSSVVVVFLTYYLKKQFHCLWWPCIVAKRLNLWVFCRNEKILFFILTDYLLLLYYYHCLYDVYIAWCASVASLTDWLIETLHELNTTVTSL